MSSTRFASLNGALAALLLGALASAYAVSDLGIVNLPRPAVARAVPATWWRRWRPYKAALVYGAVLGLGVTTRIPFGSFYILCIIAILQAKLGYGVVLLGMSGLARGLALFPASLAAFRSSGEQVPWVQRPIFNQQRAQLLAASSLAIFGAETVLAGVVAATKVM